MHLSFSSRRVRSRKCRQKFREKIPFLTSPKARVTRDFEWEMFELRSQMSTTATAVRLDVDPDTVKDAEKRILDAKYRRVDLKRVRMIGIDELYVFGNERSELRGGQLRGGTVPILRR